MKKVKHLLSLLVCLAMLCSMLPTTATAETGGSTESTGQLLYKYSGTELREMSQFPTSINTNHDIYFYHGTVDSNEAVTAITSSDPTVVELTELGDGGYKAYIAGAGTTTLSYTVGAAEYSVEVTIPEGSGEDIGGSDGPTTLAMTAYYYSMGSDGAVADGTSYPAGMDVFCPDTFFLEFKAGDTTVTSLENNNTEAVRVSESGTAGVMKVEMLAAGTAVLSATVDNVAYMFVITVTESSSSDDETGGNDTTVEPGLKYRIMNRNEDGWYEDTSWELKSEWSSAIGHSSRVKFYFFDGTTETEVALSDLTFSSHVSGSQQDGLAYIDLHAKNFGTGSISYTVGSETYSIPVTVTLRDFAFYSTETASEASYIETFKVTGTTDTFYFVAKSGTLTDVTLLDGLADFAEAERVSDTCWRITVTGAPTGGDYSIQCSGTYSGGGTFSGRYESVKIVDAKPGLKYRNMTWSEDGWYEDATRELNSEWSTAIGYGDCVKFYFFDGTTETKVALSDLTFSSHVSGSQQDGQDYIVLRAENFGTGSISYTVDGETYSIPATVTLRDFAFYSTETASEASYLESFKVTGTSDVFYFVAKNGTLTDVALNSDFDAIADVAKVSETCWKITVTGTPEGRYYGIRYSGAYSGGGTFSDRNENIHLVDVKPGLKYRNMTWSEDGWYEDTSWELNSEWSSGIGYSNCVKFYFFDGTNETEVALSDLTFSSHVSGSQQDGQDYIVLRAENFGTGSISYTVDGETYSIPVTVTLRDFAFYSTETASEVSYLESFKVTGTSDVFYFVAKNGTLTDVALNSDFDAIADVAKVSETCWKITVTGTPEGRYYGIRYSGAYSGGGTFSGRYESVKIVDAKPGLKYRNMTWSEDGWYEDTSWELNSEWSSGIGYSNCVKFYFFDGSTETEVALSDLTFSSHVSGSQQDGLAYIDLLAENFGTGSISYTVNGETYSVSVTVSLPDHGFYSSEAASEETYLSSFEVTEESDTFYFIASGGCLTDVTLESASEEIADAVQISDTCWKITITGLVDRFWLSLTYTGTDEWNNEFFDWRNGIQVIGKSGGSSGGDSGDDSGGEGVAPERPALPVITLGGVEYTVGIGDANGSSIVFLGQGVNIGCYPGTTLAIVAMSGYEEGTLEEAPAAVYQYITSIEVEVTDFTNLDESGDQTAANCTYTYGTKEHHGALLPTFTVNAEENDFFTSEIAVKVTIKDPETGEETTYSIPSYMNYVETITIGLEATGITTAAGLNQILASDEAFLAWMKEKYPEDYERFQFGKEKGFEVNVVLTLPAGTYDDAVVVANVTEYVSIWLNGNRGTERTVLRGLYLVESFNSISHIDFVADPDMTMTFDNETFTCGILLARDKTTMGFASTYSIDDCSFTGFDYAVRCTDSGLGMTLNGCRIVECGVGFYMDSYERDGGPWAGSVENTLFMNNETAVQIVSLPQYLSPYNFRVNDCDFISNDIDFDVDNPGIFYFYRNYYGGFIDPSGELSVDNVQYRTALARYDFAENGTIVVTNPRRIAPSTFGPEDDRLCIDPTPGLYTVILNGMADELVIDSESLEDMEEEAEITVSDEKEEEMGKWKFKDKKGHK